MTIREIAEIINERTKNNNYLFGSLQYLRKAKYGRVGSFLPFPKRNIKDKGRGNYAFHSGGISELQFNIGKLASNGGDYFRYGLAFNLRRGKSLHYPMQHFESRVKRFDDFFSTHKNYFKNLEMWYVDNNNKYEYCENVRRISPKYFSYGNFIFIGKSFKKPIPKVNSRDISIVINEFDRLMKLYIYVEDLRTNKIITKVAGTFPNKKQSLQLEVKPTPNHKTKKQKTPTIGKESQGQGKQYFENKDIGNAGEELVLVYEKNKLKLLGLNNKVKKIEKMGYGCDIISFNKDGEKIYIEIKTTTSSADTPFFMSSNEYEVMKTYYPNYKIYRLYNFNKKNQTAKFYIIEDDVKKKLDFVTSQYSVDVK